MSDDVKQEVQAMNIVVKDQQGTEVHFKIKLSTKFEKVFKAYCDKKGLSMAEIRFLYENERLRSDTSPADMHMEDGDTIDAVINQLGGADEGVKKEGGSESINLVVKNQSGDEVHFKVKSTTRFEKIMKAYCEKKGIDVNTIKFVFDGKRIEKEQSPAGLDMEDGDTVDAIIEQLGGFKRQLENSE